MQRNMYAIAVVTAICFSLLQLFLSTLCPECMTQGVYGKGK